MRTPILIPTMLWLVLEAVAVQAHPAPEIESALAELRLADARRLLAAAPDDEPAVLYFRARIAIWDHATERALELASRCLDIASGASICHEVWGEAISLKLLDSGLFEQYSLARQSRSAWERAVELDHGNVRARLMLLRYYRQAPWIVGGSREKAMAEARVIAEYDTARAIEANGLNAYFDRDYAKALQLFLTARSRVNDSADPRYYVPLAAARLGDHATAIRAFAELVEDSPDEWDGWLFLGYAELKARPAIDVSEQTLWSAGESIRPDTARAEALYAYGRMLTRIEEPDAGRAAFAAALRADDSLVQAARALEALR
jgi:tetratricopeptide (TPR) repeat protein